MHVEVMSIVVLDLCDRWQGRKYCGIGFKTHSLSLHILKDFITCRRNIDSRNIFRKAEIKKKLTFQICYISCIKITYLFIEITEQLKCLYAC
jgi:hypothetical protein